MTIFWTIYTFIIGLCIGSFLNVVIFRGFSGESIVLPPSHCNKCEEKLKWYDNIPLLSYLILRGKCRYCGEKISPQYPLVELFTGLIFAGLFYKFGMSINTIFLMAASALCIVMTVCDIREKIIFDLHAYLLAGLGLVYNFFNFAGVNPTKIGFWLFGFKISLPQAFIYAVLGLIVGVVIMEVLARLPKLFIGKRAFGEGDSYIAGALGALLGVSNIFVILILSLIIQVIIIFPMFITKLFKEKEFRLIGALLLLIVSVVVYKTGEYYEVFTSQMFHWFAMILVASIGYYCCKKLMESAKTGKSLTYVPFGPALIAAAFVVIFAL